MIGERERTIDNKKHSAFPIVANDYNHYLSRPTPPSYANDTLMSIAVGIEADN